MNQSRLHRPSEQEYRRTNLAIFLQRLLSYTPAAEEKSSYYFCPPFLSAPLAQFFFVSVSGLISAALLHVLRPSLLLLLPFQYLCHMSFRNPPPRSLFLSPSKAVKYWWRVNDISSMFQRNDAAQPPSLSWLFFSLFFPHSCVFVMPPCFIYDGSWAFFFLSFFFLHCSSLPLFLWGSFVSLDWQWICVILSFLMDLHENTHSFFFFKSAYFQLSISDSSQRKSLWCLHFVKNF